MRSCLLTRCKRYCIGVILILPALLSAWTCSAIEDFKSCPGAVPQPQIHAACSELYLAQRKLSYRCPGGSCKWRQRYNLRLFARWSN
jgi:hypothetical protein